VTLSDTSAFKTSSTGALQKGDLTIGVNKLAEASKSVMSDFAGYINSNTICTDLGITSGNISFNYYSDTSNPKTNQITVAVENGDTLGSLLDKINQAMDNAVDKDGNSLGLADVNASITADGKFHMDLGAHTTNESNFKFTGANGASSNFFDVMGLSFNPNVVPTSFEGQSKTWLNMSGKLLDNSANLRVPVTEGGKINIAGVEITVDENTTVKNIIDAVNRSDSSSAKAVYDKNKNQLTFTGKDGTYSDYIYFSGASLLSNYGFTDANGVWNNSGSQHTQRKDGEIVIKRTTIAVKSNTVASNESGVEGLTLNLLKTTASDEPITVTVADDTDSLVKAVSGVVDSFNSIVDTISKYTFSDTKNQQYGILKSDYTIIGMQSDIRSAFMSAVDSTTLEYKAVSLIGITSGAVGTSASTTTSKLEFDKEDFLKAYADNPDEVRTLLLGNSSEGVTGVFQNLKSKMDSYLDYTNGYFVTRQDTISKSITSLDKSITEEQTRLDNLKTKLTQQYAKLEQTITDLQSQST
jgi:flagellar hook-associated protein 2